MRVRTSARVAERSRHRATAAPGDFVAGVAFAASKHATPKAVNELEIGLIRHEVSCLPPHGRIFYSLGSERSLAGQFLLPSEQYCSDAALGQHLRYPIPSRILAS